MFVPHVDINPSSKKPQKNVVPPRRRSRPGAVRLAVQTGVMYIGAARCIAMVLVWTAIAGGDQFLCVSLVLLLGPGGDLGSWSVDVRPVGET